MFLTDFLKLGLIHKILFCSCLIRHNSTNSSSKSSDIKYDFWGISKKPFSLKTHSSLHWNTNKPFLVYTHKQKCIKKKSGYKNVCKMYIIKYIDGYCSPIFPNFKQGYKDGAWLILPIICIHACVCVHTSSLRFEV